MVIKDDPPESIEKNSQTVINNDSRMLDEYESNDKKDSYPLKNIQQIETNENNSKQLLLFFFFNLSLI